MYCLIILISLIIFFWLCRWNFLSVLFIFKFSKTVNGDEQDEKVKPVVQQRGRFKVTSENVDIERVSLILIIFD